MTVSTTNELAPPAPSTLGPPRSLFAASRAVLGALILRDLTVLKKHFGEFVARTIVQPFLLVFVFLYVFPRIGQGVGGAGRHTPQSAFATVLVPGVVAASIMFQGIQAVALQMSAEFGFTREIEDRVQAPVPYLAGGDRQGAFRRGAGHTRLGDRLSDRRRYSRTRRAHALSISWPIVVTIIPLASVAMTSLGLLLGTTFETRNLGLMFGFVVLPLLFLGGTYYQWTRLAPITVGPVSWLPVL